MQIVPRLVAFLLCLAPAAEANGKNAHAFKALCLNFNVATATVTDTDYTGEQQTPAVPDDVLYLYMSSMKSKDYLNKTSALVDDTEAGWKTKKETLESVKDDAGNRLYPIEPDSPTKQAANNALEKIFNESTTLANSIEQIKREIIATTKEAREALSTAAYGGKDLTDVPDSQFGGRATTCGGSATATKPGISIAHDMVCVCSGGTDGTGICGDGIGTTTYDHSKTGSNKAEIKGLFDALKTKCSKQRITNKASPEAIRAAIAAFEQTLGKAINDGSGVQLKLGNNAAGDCTGSGSETTCIDYAGVAGAGNILSIAWVSQMEEAANKLAEAASRRADLEAARAEMRQQQTAAWAAAALLKLKLPDMPQTVQAAAKPQTSETDCNKHQSKADCTKAGCDYDENAADGKKCKPKSEKETTAAGTGETSSVVDCNKHQTQQACEAENKNVKAGERAFCGWIDFVDGTAKLPKPECRSLIFLVNKKLAMMTSRFVSLPFLNF